MLHMLLSYLLPQDDITRRDDRLLSKQEMGLAANSSGYTFSLEHRQDYNKETLSQLLSRATAAV